jgi:ABC-type branched-subunit amino acid transport system ATPase component
MCRTGDIRYDGGAIADSGQALRARFARVRAAIDTHVWENRRLFPRMSVENNLRMGGFIPRQWAQVRCRNARPCAVVPWMSLR